MKSLLALIRGQAETAKPDDAKRLVERAHADREAAEAYLAAAREAYQASLLQDDEKATIAAQMSVLRSEALLDRATAATRLAQDRHASAEARAVEAARAASYEAAKAKVAAALQALDFYDEYARMLRDIIKAVAESNIAVAGANADLPEGATPLVPAEKLARGAPRVPERELGREALPDTWFYTGAHAMWGEVAAHHHREIKSTGPDTGVLEIRGRDTPLVQAYPVERRSGGVKITYLPERQGSLPDALHTQVVLPGLRAGDPMIWKPTGELNYLHEMGGDGPAVLAAVEAREAEPKRTYDEMSPVGSPCERIEQLTPVGKVAAE